MDGRVEAVLKKKDCGATTSIAYSVVIVPTGGTSQEEPIFVADKATALDLGWSADRKLLITYESARIFSFTNFWQSREMDNFNYVVAIEERYKGTSKNSLSNTR